MANGKQIYSRSKELKEVNGFLRTFAAVVGRGAIPAIRDLSQSGGFVNRRGGLDVDRFTAGAYRGIDAVVSGAAKAQKLQGIQQAKEKKAAEEKAAAAKAAAAAAYAKSPAGRSEARIKDLQAQDAAKDAEASAGRDVVALAPERKPDGTIPGSPNRPAQLGPPKPPPSVIVNNKPTIQQKYKARVTSTLLTPANPNDVTGRI